MVFSGSAGTRPDCSFAFKFPINQSISQSTIYDATLIVQLNAFYRSLQFPVLRFLVYPVPQRQLVIWFLEYPVNTTAH